MLVNYILLILSYYTIILQISNSTYFLSDNLLPYEPNLQL